MTHSQASGPAVSAGHPGPRNPAASVGQGFAALLQGLSGAEPLAEDAPLLSEAQTLEPVSPGKEDDSVPTGPADPFAMAWPDLMLMQRSFGQVAETPAVAGPDSLDLIGTRSGAPLQPAMAEGVRERSMSAVPQEPDPVTRAGAPHARVHLAEDSSGPGADARGLLSALAPSPASRGESKPGLPEAALAASPPAPAMAAGRVDPAQVRDLPAPDFRLSLRNQPSEAASVAIQPMDSTVPEQQHTQRQNGSAPDDGRGREGSATEWLANRHHPVDETQPAAGFLPEDLATAAQNAPDGMAYWSTQGVHTGEIQLQDGLHEPMSIRVRVSGEEAQVSFAADHAAMREQLASSADQLQALLGESGIRLTDVSVGTSGGQPQPQNPSRPDPGARARTNASRGSALEPLVPLRPSSMIRPSSGRLDVFA